ncbi:MAG: hypothetical protein ACRD9S_24155 [Pyrinomonadaceae bacterium]
MNKLGRYASALSIAWIGGAVIAAHATLTPQVQRGEKIIEIPVAGRRAEICIIPKHFQDADYSKKDLKTEEELCALQVGKNAAVCPKINSTNPGLNIYDVPEGSTAQTVEAANCKVNGAHKIAKYKLSTSCSYSPSLLGYYHVSRILGGVGGVPPAVLRTYDVQNQLALGRKAQSMVKAGSLIAQTWAGLTSKLAAGARGSKRDLLLTDDFTQSYGALIDNPRGEAGYREFFNGGANSVSRAQAFRDKSAVMGLLSRTADVSTFVGRELNPANLQRMMQMKDASEMIILDIILNQQDRFGNIHSEDRYYYYDSKDPHADGTPNLASERKLKPDEIAQLGAIKIKKIVLKDNDCGVAKDNVAKKAGLNTRIAHMDLETYQRLLRLNATADDPAVAKFFTQGLMFTAADFASVRRNLSELVTLLHDKCERGQLKLDLDLDVHFSGRPLTKASCGPKA